MKISLFFFTVIAGCVAIGLIEYNHGYNSTPLRDSTVVKYGISDTLISKPVELKPIIDSSEMKRKWWDSVDKYWHKVMYGDQALWIWQKAMLKRTVTDSDGIEEDRRIRVIGGYRKKWEKYLDSLHVKPTWIK